MSLTQTLLGSLLDSPAVVETTAQVLEKAVPVLLEHFTFTADEITRAYQESCRYSFVAISIGLNAPDSFYKKLRYSNITREFATQIKQNYLQPFSQQHGEPDINLLVKPLRKWAKQTHQLLLNQYNQEDLSALIGYRETFAISKLILAQMQEIETVDETLAKFLTFQELLGHSVLFFFRERLRKDPRIQATQAALQQENLCIEVKNLQATLDDLKSTQEKHPFLAEQITLQIQRLEQWQVQHETLLGWQNRFAEQLDEVLDWAEDISLNLDQLKEDVAETKETVVKTYDLAAEINQKLDDILTAQQQNHSAQINHRDGTVQYAPKNRELLTALLKQLQQLSPQHPGYGQVSNKIGRVLSSSGALDEAARLFERLIEQSTQKADQALAHFNLFQVRWRQAFTATTVSAKEKLYAQALISLQHAIDLDRAYALHDISQGKGYYPIEKMLGAGGMGCTFLCQNQNFQLKGHQQVVVKCFWENISGNLKQLFQEPQTMYEIAGDYVPEILDYGYADNVQQTKPYFVIEYLEGTMDGEAWLEKMGRLDLTTGLQVALQIAQALQQAHQQGICHLDLKPANLLLIKINGKVFVKIIDFGLARVTTGFSAGVDSRSGVTKFGQAIFGTWDYAPPEQRGEAYRYGAPSAKSDVFAFGMTMYCLWTGENPHPFMERNLPDISDLRNLLCHCVASNPEKRPESAYLVKCLTPMVGEYEQDKKARQQEAEKNAVIEADEKAWNKARQENTIEAYQAYLEGNTQKKYADDAKKQISILIDEQAWNKAHQENTVKAYQAYLEGNTLKKYANDAKKQISVLQIEIDEKAWSKARQKNTVEAYQAYLKGNTLKKYANDAKKQKSVLEIEADEKTWQQASEKNTEEAYREYLNGNTIKRHANEAKRWLKLHKEPSPLNPLNPLDYLRLLWWVLVMPQKLKMYKERFGTPSVLGKWLTSTLTWLPLLMPTLALGLELIPHAINGASEVYLSLTTILLIGWLLTGWLGDIDRDDAVGVAFDVAGVVAGYVALAVALAVAFDVTGVVALDVAGFVAIGVAVGVAGVVAGYVALAVTSGGVAVVVALAVAVGVAVGMAVVVALAVAVGVIDDVAIIIAVIVGAVIFFGILFGFVIIGTVIKKSIKNGTPSWIARFAFFLLVTAHLFLIYYYFLGGWRWFV